MGYEGACVGNSGVNMGEWVGGREALLVEVAVLPVVIDVIVSVVSVLIYFASANETNNNR